MTDGEIHDFEVTIDLIVKASRMPISIIVIGIGNCDFEKMELLNRSDYVLSFLLKKNRIVLLIRMEMLPVEVSFNLFNIIFLIIWMRLSRRF